MLKRLLVAVVLGTGLLTPVAAMARDADPVPGAQTHSDAAAHEKPSLIPDPTSKETWIQALWTVIIFLVLVAILYPTAWKKVLAGLKQREQRIRKDIADAEESRRKAEETLRQYNQQLAEAEVRVRDMLTKATADGEKLAATIRIQAQREAEEIKERTQKDIEQAKNNAIGEIHEYAAEIGTAVAEKIIGRNLNVEDQRELVRRSLDQLESLHKN